MNSKINQWWVLIIMGLLLTATGMFLMTKPEGTFLGLTIMFGWLIFSVGGLNVVLPYKTSLFLKIGCGIYY